MDSISMSQLVRWYGELGYSRVSGTGDTCVCSAPGSYSEPVTLDIVVTAPGRLLRCPESLIRIGEIGAGHPTIMLTAGAFGIRDRAHLEEIMERTVPELRRRWALMNPAKAA